MTADNLEAEHILSALAVVLERPEQIEIRTVGLIAPSAHDVAVEVQWSGISTGTERLLYTGRMPEFPGMGYPLVPGYESVGIVRFAGAESGRSVGETVFVPGARCYTDVRGLFGGAAARLVTPGSKVTPVPQEMGSKAILFALAATAYHAIAAEGAAPPDLIIGHGVLGRLLARIALALGHAAPTVWETNAARSGESRGYRVIAPDLDERRDYRAAYDVSGDSKILDQLIGRLAHGGEIVLAGFYTDPLSFQFAPAFMREARIRVAAEWRADDLAAVQQLVNSELLSFDGLISHTRGIADARAAYHIAFSDPSCLKMVLDWSGAQALP